MWKLVLTGIFSVLLAPLSLGNMYLHYTQGKPFSWLFLGLAAFFVIGFFGFLSERRRGKS